jgi:WD40 repeat protein
MVVLPNVQKIILSFTDCVLGVYDISPAFDKVFHVTSLPHCVLSLDYWFDEKNTDHSILIFGDSAGALGIMEFFQVSRTMFGVSFLVKTDCCHVSFSNLADSVAVDGMKITYIPRVHNDWVNKVRYWDCMESVLSCSSDATTSLVITDIHGQKENSSIFQVNKGIISFEYSRKWNIIATGGTDQAVRLWNPYVTTKPTVILKGHNTAIIYVTINHIDGLIISFSNDKELRVWSIQNQCCVQINYQFQRIENIPVTFCFHPTLLVLLTGYCGTFGVMEGYSEDEISSEDVVSHNKSICAALYNGSFNLVVSGCHESVISVWNIDTGENIIKFSNCHGNMEITAMKFDSEGRRLITGGRDGSIKMWNFNNGACLCVLKHNFNAEVNCFLFLDRRVIASGWSQFITDYKNVKTEDTTPKFWGKGIHKDAVLCMAYQTPDILVTGSFDGDIVVWDMCREQNIFTLNATNVDYTKRYYHLYHELPVKLKKELEQIKKRKESKESEKSEDNGSKGGKFGYSNINAVEQVIILSKRSRNTISTATLVACGSGGLVQFWNMCGGGMIGEFNVFDCSNETISSIEKNVLYLSHSITACKTDSNNSVMITGTTLGYIQVWDINDYCIDIPYGQRPVREMPKLLNGWRGHTKTIVSIDIAEEKKLIITASTDCRVSLWTTSGKYIGTFGDKTLWNLSDINNTKLPPGIHQVASHNTLQTIAPAITCIADDLSSIFTTSNTAKDDSQLENVDEAYIESIMSKPSRHKGRVVPSTNFKLKVTDGILPIYSILKCLELNNCDPEAIRVESKMKETEKRTSSHNECIDDSIQLPKSLITEKMLLPNTIPKSSGST